MKKSMFFIFLVFTIISCKKENDPPLSSTETILSSDGAFIVHEGTFNWGNGSLSFYSYDSLKIYNDFFQEINERPLGDVPNSMTIYGDMGYIVVNNSGKIEVADINSMESVGTITGLNSPRYISVIDDNKAYVSSLYSDSIIIINPANNSISGYINIRRTSEAIKITGKKAFVSNWSGGNEIMVINTENNQVLDSIKVGAEPESMVIDKNNVLWVLCDRGWAGQYFPELIAINTLTYDIEKRFEFSSVYDYPSCLQINGNGDSLFYIQNGIRSLNINASGLPSSALIEKSDHLFYKLGINPSNGDIFVTDAVDYVNKGKVLLYKRDGSLISTMETDVLPASVCFKVKDN